MSQTQALRLSQTAAIAACLCIVMCLAWIGAQPGGTRILVAVVLVAVLLCAAILRPFATAATVTVVAAFAPDYLQLKFTGVPLPVNGPTVLSVLLLACGVGSLREPGRAGYSPLASLFVMGFSVFWLVSGAFVVTEGTVTHLSYVLGQGLPASMALVGAFLLAGSRPGALALLRGLCWGGVGAAAVALVEVVAGVYVFRSLVGSASTIGAAAQDAGVQSVMIRAGLLRAEAAFTHPIMLGVFLGLSLLATLELARQDAIGRVVATVATVVQAAGILSTGSRGPLVATVACLVAWMVWPGTRGRVRRQAFVVVLLAVTAALLTSRVGGILGYLGLHASEDADLTGNARYRWVLLRSLTEVWQRVTAFGYANVRASGVFPGLTSIDNQWAWLLSARGFVGAAAFLLLVFGLLASAPAARPGSVPGARFTILATTFIVLTSLAVTFFGLALPYVLAVLGMAWATIGGPTAVSSRPGPPGVDLPRREQGPS